ncbi:MAG TPA: ABC transporter ATP-binding protein [Pirellulales bacterium]|jgi:ATP-binding cassette subfamily B protein|nr:ABC transporter ATP-binding protein [Pirellulales bacterium]
MLALGWRYRAGCVAVVFQQCLLVAIGLWSLGLTGLAIDYIRATVDPISATPQWPLGLRPPESWSPRLVVAAIAGAILFLAALHTWARYIAAVRAADLTQRIVVQLRSDVYEKLQRLSFRFYDRHESGSIINRVTGDVQGVRLFVDGVMIQVIVTGLTLAVYLGYMLSVHVPLTLACLATTPIMWFASMRFSRKVRPAYQRNRAASDKLVLALSENVQGMHVVKSFNCQDREIAKFVAANEEVKNGKYEVFRKLSIFQPSIGFLAQLNLLILMGYGGRLVLQGELLLGEGLFVFANLLNQFATQVGNLANISNSIQSSITGAERVFEVLDAPLEVDNVPETPRRKAMAGHLRFEHVDFAYQPGKPVLAAIDFEARPGQCIAIAGATGSGKSTLVSLLPRFYDPTAGRVLIDSVDVRDWHLDDLRRNIGIVFQDSFLFSHSVAANIAFGHPEATREQIERAARTAAAHEFIEQLPDGYDTIIGEYGCNLSGGQRQRLAIARALLLEPPILILDDASSAVDPETEHEMLDAMARAMHGRTTLVIAHRMSTLRRADRIIVLDHGRIVQQGTHAELLAMPGYYRHAAAIQSARAHEVTAMPHFGFSNLREVV